MTIQEVVDYLNFYINKKTGAFLTIEECIEALDRGQLALYSDLKARYATSQYVKDALSPFRDSYNFTTTVSGTITVPLNTNYLDLLDIQIYYQISNRTVYAPIKLANEDERANRLSSQRDPVTATSPLGEQIGERTFRLYPAGTAYNGTVTFLKRPVKPVMAYNVISGRVIVYDSAGSTQLQWRESEVNSVVLKALQTLGINLSANDIAEWGNQKSQQNYMGENRS